MLYSTLTQKKTERAGLLSDNRLLYREVVRALSSLIQTGALKKDHIDTWCLFSRMNNLQ